jgi:hypothetical protein
VNLKKHILCFCATLILFITCGEGIAQQQKRLSKTYYVNTSGNDENNGTKNKPFQTIKKINSLHLTAGDTVFFKSGQTFNGSLFIASGTWGTKKSPIVITSYGNGRAIINAKDSSGITIYNNTYIKLQHFSLVGSGRKTGNVKDGLAIINSSEIMINDLNISGFQKSGLQIYSSQNVIVNDVFTHDNGAAGITVEGPYQKRESKDIQILNCRAENNPGDPTKLDNHSGNGIVAGNCKKLLIDHCTATNNGWDMPRIGNGPVGIWAYEADSVIIQHCLSYRNKTSKGGADGGGFDFDGGVTNSIIQYCFSYENQGSGYCIFQYWGASPWHHNIFRYNISENDGTVSDSQAGLYVWNSSDDEKQFYDCDVYGNIIYNSKVAAIHFSEKSENKGFRFYNNIFVGKDSLITGRDKIGEVVYQGNDWWSLTNGFNIDGIKDFKTWAIKTGKEQKDGKIIGLNEDPKFKSPAKASITSATQLKSFTSYRLFNPELSKLLKGSMYPQTPVEKWQDTDRHFINAHGAGVLYHNGIYYLFGEIKKGETWLVPEQGWEDYRAPAGGVSCYSSKDLKHWKYESIALAPVKGDPENDLDTSKVIERPKVIYNGKTHQFIMWMHVDAKDYSYSQAGVAVSNNPVGPYRYLHSVKPNGQMARDMTLFKDDDDKAYLVYSSEQNNTMQVCLLSDDYLSSTKTFSRILIGRRREAPALFKNDGKYYLITSSCTGWSPNAATYAVADKPLGPWKEYDNPCKGPGAETTFDAQSTFVLPVNGKTKTYIFMADRWNKSDLEKSDYLWLPLTINNGKVEIKRN